MKAIYVITALLLIIGGLNWGLVGLFQFNLVEYLFGHYPMVERTIYGLVGLSAVYQAIQCKACKERLSCCDTENKKP